MGMAAALQLASFVWILLSLLMYPLLSALFFLQNRVLKLRKKNVATLCVGVGLIFPSILMASFKSSAKSEKNFVAFTFYNLFFLAGIVLQVVEDWPESADDPDLEMGRPLRPDVPDTQSSPKTWLLRPLTLFIGIILFLLSFPDSERRVGYLWTYPLYKRRIPCTFYVIGTWIWLYVLSNWSRHHLNDPLNKFAHVHSNRSTIVVYLVHWFFIEVSVRLFVLPYSLSFSSSMIVVSTMSIALSLLWYWILCSTPFVGMAFGVRRGEK
jgi:hypothetical protein